MWVIISDLSDPLFCLESSVEVDPMVMLIDQQSLHAVLLYSVPSQDMDVQSLLLRLLQLLIHHPIRILTVN